VVALLDSRLGPSALDQCPSECASCGNVHRPPARGVRADAHGGEVCELGRGQRARGGRAGWGGGLGGDAEHIGTGACSFVAGLLCETAGETATPRRLGEVVGVVHGDLLAQTERAHQVAARFEFVEEVRELPALASRAAPRPAPHPRCNPWGVSSASTAWWAGVSVSIGGIGRRLLARLELASCAQPVRHRRVVRRDCATVPHESAHTGDGTRKAAAGASAADDCGSGRPRRAATPRGRGGRSTRAPSSTPERSAARFFSFRMIVSRNRRERGVEE
jgi:hypothetical protein